MKLLAFFLLCGVVVSVVDAYHPELLGVNPHVYHIPWNFFSGQKDLDIVLPAKVSWLSWFEWKGVNSHGGVLPLDCLVLG